MRPPSAETVFQTLDNTWPAARQFERDGWVLRQGKGGGKRVSAATALDPGRAASIDTAESGMRGLDQRPLFMVRPGEDALDDDLAQRGYDVIDPVTIYAALCDEIARKSRPAEVIVAWPPLAIQTEIWAEGGIGPARLDVMARATCEKTALLGRVADRSAATVYVGLDGEVAMLHALETRPAHRRQGAGRKLVQATAQWASDKGATWLTLAVVTDNHAANALYRALGMQPVTSYHYRISPEGAV